MRVLLDECVPKRLAEEIRDHEVRTVQQEGWAQLDNGSLLDAIGNKFDVFVTVDENLPLQQNLAARAFGIIVLRAKSSRLQDLLPLVPALLELIPRAEPGRAHEVAR